MTYKNAIVEWKGKTITVSHGATATREAAIDDFHIEIKPEAQGRLDVFLVYREKEQKFEYVPILANLNDWESIDPGAESWNQELIFQAHFYRAPLPNEKLVKDYPLRKNHITYVHKELDIDASNLNPNDYFPGDVD